MNIDNVELMQPLDQKIAVANFPIRLSEPAFGNISVKYMTRDVTATAGIDYQETRGIVKFLPLQREAFVPVTIYVNAQTGDMNRDFEVVLYDAVNARIVKGVGSGMIFQQGLFYEHFSHTILPKNWKFQGAWLESNHCLMGAPLGLTAISAFATPAFAGCKNCTVQVGIESGKGGSLSFYPWFVDEDNYVEVLMNETQDTWTIRQRMHGIVVSKDRLKSPILPGEMYHLILNNYNGNFRLTLQNGMYTEIKGIEISGTIGLRSHNTIAEIDYLFVREMILN